MQRLTRVGTFFGWDSPDTQVTIYGPHTKAVYSSRLQQGKRLNYFVWAVDSGGMAARAYELHDDRNGEGRIDLLDRGGRPIHTIVTGAYTPEHLTFAPDHTIWTVGYDVLYACEYASEPRPDYPKGTEIGSDGVNLIFSDHIGGWTVLHSVSSTSLKVDHSEQQVAGLH